MNRLMLVRFNRDTGEFDDLEFNRFCREHNVVRIEKRFLRQISKEKMNVPMMSPVGTAYS